MPWILWGLLGLPKEPPRGNKEPLIPTFQQEGVCRVSADHVSIRRLSRRTKTRNMIFSFKSREELLGHIRLASKREGNTQRLHPWHMEVSRLGVELEL